MCGPRSIIRKSETKMFMCSYIDYLTNWKQRVAINGKESSWKTVNAGVSQGSILGPLLFLIFINDIVDEVNCPIKLFADDTSINI
jgi:hypothetical protein